MKDLKELHGRVRTLNKILRKKGVEWDFYSPDMEYTIDGESSTLFYDSYGFLKLFDAVADMVASFEPNKLNKKTDIYQDKSVHSNPTNTTPKPLLVANIIEEGVQFIIHCTTSIEHGVFRKAVGKYVGNDVYIGLSPFRLAYIKIHDPFLYKYIHKSILSYEKKIQKLTTKGQNGPATIDPGYFFKGLLEKTIQCVELIAVSINGDIVCNKEQPDSVPNAVKSIYSLVAKLVSLYIDILAQLPTRRNIVCIFEDLNFIQRVHFTGITKNTSNSCSLLVSLFVQLEFYLNFEVNNLKGTSMTETQLESTFFAKIYLFQQKLYLKYDHNEELREFALLDVVSFSQETSLATMFSLFTLEQLIELYNDMGFTYQNTNSAVSQQEYLTQHLIKEFSPKVYQLSVLKQIPVYPSEAFLFDIHVLPYKYKRQKVLALPKLNLQFLTITDYLYRNFMLLFLENTFKIREDVINAVARFKNRSDAHGNLYLEGWNKMAMPINTFSLVEVAQPKIGETAPAHVVSDISFSYTKIPNNRDLIQEWDALKKHDILFLITLAPAPPSDSEFTIANINESELQKSKGKKVSRGKSKSTSGISEAVWSLPSNTKYPLNIKHVRGCEVMGFVDSVGQIIVENENNNNNNNPSNVDRSAFKGTERTIRISLDPNQYYKDCIESKKNNNKSDTLSSSSGSYGIYSEVNLLIRRKPQENNFKAILETIKTMLNTDCAFPNWMLDLLLGYGDPSESHFFKLHSNNNASTQRKITFNMRDTYLNKSHLQRAFPNVNIKYADNELSHDQQHNQHFTLTFPTQFKYLTEKTILNASSKSDSDPTIHVEIKKIDQPDYLGLSPDTFKVNKIPFTSEQSRAICTAMYPGLSIVVGPPGTGKTDLAVQIISNWYHNFPNEKILLVTHSNQALNQLFEKIAQLDIDERHLLRLGSGEKEMQMDKIFTRYGRVNYILEKRLALLNQVNNLAASLGNFGDVGYTCETAGYFFKAQIIPRWNNYINQCEAIVLNENSETKTTDELKLLFPFNIYFHSATTPSIFDDKLPICDNIQRSKTAYALISDIFTQLAEFQAFETMRGGKDRVNYMLTNEARIVAMTCTHAALKRNEFIRLGFKFDNILMEEAAQILEIETFIPILCQSQVRSGSSSNNNNTTTVTTATTLKRVVLIGDHYQLPPVIQNRVLDQFSNFDQSMFSRFIRLGAPHIQLDSQGRSRPSIADLYRWRYKNLKDLPNVSHINEFLVHNTGFLHEYQFIDVADFNGKGETTPFPYYYQNLAEAEFIVATFMYMRLCGYPSDKISVLTTYNGQKALLQDIFNSRCGSQTPFGLPNVISTVDKYQGQQNDYILLSLVRTQSIGHLRDIRRMVVALSRARLGLYIFGRKSLFATAESLKPALTIMFNKPTDLILLPHETFPTTRVVNSSENELQLQFVTIKCMVQLVEYVNVTYLKRLQDFKNTGMPITYHDDEDMIARGDNDEVITEDELNNEPGE